MHTRIVRDEPLPPDAEAHDRAGDHDGRERDRHERASAQHHRRDSQRREWEQEYPAAHEEQHGHRPPDVAVLPHEDSAAKVAHAR